MDVGCRRIGFCFWIQEVFFGWMCVCDRIIDLARLWQPCGGYGKISTIFMFKYLRLAVARQDM